MDVLIYRWVTALSEYKVWADGIGATWLVDIAH